MTPPDSTGILLIDKPTGWTSHDVVARVRRLASTRRVGHAGTLDPMATGLLILGVGRATRLLTFLVGCDKQYTATIRLGQSTLTDDADGDVTTSAGAGGVSRASVAAAARPLIGDVMQVPSAVSAIKVKGRRAYHRVRSGEDVVLPARPVTVSQFEIGAVRHLEADGLPILDVDVTVSVSAGTYVRALARDLGAVLGCGGHLTALRRTRVGAYDIAAAHRLDHLEQLGEQALPVVPAVAAARAAFPVRDLDAGEARALGLGQRLPSQQPGRVGPVAAIGPDDALVAVVDESALTTRSLVVFTPATS
jgi:tRNA pseudouridine55 synthase